MRFNALSFIVAALLCPGAALAADHYVRSGAAGAGDGSDWDNAWTALPSSLVRGDTYYVADGSYPSYTFDDPLSGSLVISVKKATAADHGTDAGWQGAYGDGVAVFAAPFTFLFGYYLIDGQVGGGPGSWERGHGIKVDYQGTAGGFAIIRIGNSSHINTSHLTFRHLEIVYSANLACDGADGCSSREGGQDAVYSMYATSDLTFQYCWIHHASRTIFFTSESGYSGPTARVLIEHCLLERNGVRQTSDNHSEIWSSMWTTDVTVRYSYIKNYVSTGGLIMRMGERWDVYGNIFQWTHAFGSTANNGAVGTLQSGAGYGGTDVTVHNNTFVGLSGGGSGSIFPAANRRENIRVYNNVWYDSPATTFAGGLIHDYNWFKGSNEGRVSEPNMQVGAGDPFIDYAGNDFRLAAPTNAGTSLPPPYDLDMDGNVRGGDGTWDRGAHEYGGAVAACAAMPGTCCAAGELCAGGAFALSSDCGRLCCAGGSCATPPPSCWNQGYGCCAACASGAQPVFDGDCGSGVCCAACAAAIFFPEDCVEAELGELTAPLAAGDDPAASGGRYVAAATAEQGAVAFSFEVAEAGDYALGARVMTPSPALSHDSFYVGLDGAPVQGSTAQVYDVLQTITFAWDVVRLRGSAAEPATWTLAPGRHTFSFWGRERDSRLDQVALRLCAPGSGCTGLAPPDCATPSLDDGGPLADGAQVGDAGDTLPAPGDSTPDVGLSSGCACRSYGSPALLGWLGALLLARRRRLWCGAPEVPMRHNGLET